MGEFNITQNHFYRVVKAIGCGEGCTKYKIMENNILEFSDAIDRMAGLAKLIQYSPDFSFDHFFLQKMEDDVIIELGSFKITNY